MNKLLFFFILLFQYLSSYSQIMEWIAKPIYKEIIPISGTLYKIKTNNDKWGVYNISERRFSVNPEYDSITSVVENRALILDKTGIYLYGIFSDDAIC